MTLLRSSTLAILVALGASAHAAGAQAALPSASAAFVPALQALALPEGQPLVCLIPEPAPDDTPQIRALVRRQFLIAPQSTEGLPPGFPSIAPRELQVGWDSTGQPVLLHDQAGPPLRNATIVLALFHPTGAVAGRHIFIEADTARIAAALRSGDPMRATDPGFLRPPVTRDLTAEEAARARTLVAWLWARRCRGAA